MAPPGWKTGQTDWSRRKHSTAFDGPHGHLAGQAETLADLAVTEAVQRHLAEDLGREADPGGIGCSGVEPFHRGQEIGLLLGGREQLELERQLHACVVTGLDPTIKTEAAIPPSPEGDGILAAFL